jgi:hypothetical protein
VELDPGKSSLPQRRDIIIGISLRPSRVPRGTRDRFGGIADRVWMNNFRSDFKVIRRGRGPRSATAGRFAALNRDFGCMRRACSRIGQDMPDSGKTPDPYRT